MKSIERRKRFTDKEELWNKKEKKDVEERKNRKKRRKKITDKEKLENKKERKKV